MKLKAFLESQAKKAGYTVEAGALDNVPDFDISDDMVKGIDNSLISITDAKNNHPDIKKYYQSQTLSSVDAVLKRILDTNPELAEDDEIKGETSTYKRMELITSKIVDLAAKKASATGGKEKNDIQKQIDELHAQLKAANDGRAADKQTFDKSLKDFKIKSQIASLLGSHRTIHDELPADVKATILETLIYKELSDQQASFDFDQTGKFTLLKSDGSNFYSETHNQVSPVEFIEKALAKNKQLKVSSGQQANNQQQQQTTQQDATGKNASVIRSNQAALEAFNKGTAANQVVFGG